MSGHVIETTLAMTNAGETLGTMARDECTICSDLDPDDVSGNVVETIPDVTNAGEILAVDERTISSFSADNVVEAPFDITNAVEEIVEKISNTTHYRCNQNTTDESWN